MKKQQLFGLVLGVIAVVLLALAAVLIFRDGRIVLSAEYRGDGGIGTITIDELRTMTEEKKSFILFVSQPECKTAEHLRGILQELISEYPVQIFEVSFSDLKNSGLADEVRFYQSLVIYRQGKIADFLDANDDADTEAYNSLGGLKAWLTNVVILDYKK